LLPRIYEIKQTKPIDQITGDRIPEREPGLFLFKRDKIYFQARKTMPSGKRNEMDFIPPLNGQ
jgi:hypothetical protein